MSEKKTGGQIIWESLMREGVEVVFGLPGGAILPAYDDLAKYEYPIHHVLVTHEQGASHMADGYARATGRIEGAPGSYADFRGHVLGKGIRRVYGWFTPASRAPCTGGPAVFTGCQQYMAKQIGRAPGWFG